VFLAAAKSRILEPLAFHGKCRFWFFSCANRIKRASLYSLCARKKNKNDILALFSLRKKKNKNDIFHEKLKVPTSEREGKLSNPRGRAACGRCMEKFYGNLRKPARLRRARAMD
jgi:hypothetical protein